MITVISRRAGGYHPDTSDGTIVYIGRGTPLGNQENMHNNSSQERDRVCDWYEDWLENKLRHHDAKVCVEIRRLSQISEGGILYLQCWCAPLRCHGDIIKRFIETHSQV